MLNPTKWVSKAFHITIKHNVVIIKLFASRKFDANSVRQYVPGLRLQATIAFADKKSVQQLRRPHSSVAICSREFRHTDGFLKALRS